MTTLYKPAKITSADQAEALPTGTIAIEGPGSASPVGACIKGSDGGWYGTGEPAPWSSEAMVGDMALVPIGAEEEWRASWASGLSYQECRTERQARRWVEQHDAVAMRRLVTPWEEA